MNYRKIYYGFYVKLLVIIAVLLSACSSNSPETQSQLSGRILVWHSLEKKEAQVLNTIFNNYTALHPEVKIVTEYLPEANISKSFLQTGKMGLGPDLIISWYQALPDFIDAGIVQSLNDYNLDTSIYLPVALSQVRLQNRLYGLPFAMYTQALCYNKAYVSQPPKTLSGLMQEVRAGRKVALTSNFVDTVWGVPIFGGQLFDDRGRIILARGGWAEWLEWLKQAKKEPNFILNGERQIIREEFATGELAYYDCVSEQISDLKAALGEEQLGVVPLPGEANRASAPLINTRTLVFNRASAPKSTKLALQLARFLTNVQQQTKLALQTESLVPVNREVELDIEIDRSLSPIQAAFLAQSQTAVAVPLFDVYRGRGRITKSGENLYNRVLEGEMTSTEAALQLTEIINQKFGWD